MGNRNYLFDPCIWEKERFFLCGEIDEETTNHVIMQLILLANDGPEPITIYLNSPGGEVASGLAIYDILQQIPIAVNIVGMSTVASMAAVILAGWQKGRRFLLPHCKLTDLHASMRQVSDPEHIT